MALREKLGRLVLLEETEVGVLGREHRAARLGPTGLDRLVTVLSFAPGISSQAVVTKRLMDEARLAARLQNPGLVRVLGIGRVEQTFYVSTELVEGRTLAAVFERCRRESFPFAADHALMVASRVASALEYLHGKKDDAGARLFHGLLAPSRIVVSYDGEVKLKGLGLWPALRETDLLGGSERAYLAPEQTSGSPGDPRSDVYALGLVLLQALTGREPDGRDPRGALADAKVVSVSGESSPVPKLLSEMLERALGDDPASRYASMAEMRKGIDTLLFSGDFTPTTFDLAFFMHTLFRDDMDREARAIDEARRADYHEFIEEKPAAAATPAPEAPRPGSAPSAVPAVAAASESPTGRPTTSETTRPVTPTPPPAAVSSSVLEAPAAPTLVAPGPDSSAPRPPTFHPEPIAPAPAVTPEPTFVPPDFGRGAETHPSTPEKPVEHHASRDDHHATREGVGRSSRDATGRDVSLRVPVVAAASPPSSRRGLWLALAGVLAVGVVVGGAWILIVRSGTATTPAQPAPLTPEAAAALARVKELESRLADLERQRTEAETTAAEKVRKEFEAQATAKKRAVDEAALKKAQDEAKARVRLEQDARQQQELRRLAEAKKEQEARLAAEMKAAEAASTPVPVPPPTTAAAPPTTEAAAPPPGAPAAAAASPETTPSPTSAPTQPGSLVSANDPKLIPPFLVSENKVVYPPLAYQHGIEGSVDLTALVDENGRVADVTVARAKPRNVGFESAALQSVRSRRYRPGTKDGVPVRVWVTIHMEFKRR